MMHARTKALPAATPVEVAITAHRAAYDAFQVAPDGEASLRAETRYDEASMALAAAVCDTPADAVALFHHLIWWLGEEAPFSSGHEPAYGIALARAKDLGLYLAALAPPTPLPQAAPSGCLAAQLPGRSLPIIDLRPRTALDASPDGVLTGEVEVWEAVEPSRPDAPHLRALRAVELVGETLTAAVIVVGGIVLTGLSTLI